MSDKSSAYASAELGTALRGDDPGRHIRPYAGLIDNDRVLKMLNYYDSLTDEDIEETKIGQLIIANAATDTIDEAVRAGNVSQMKSATGLTISSGESKESFYLEVAERLSDEGAIGLVFGSPGCGKTATIMDCARVWRAMTGGTIIANIAWDGADKHFESDREMLEAMASVKGPVLAILDEIAQELSGFGSGSKKAEAFSDSLLFIRKREEEFGPYAKRGSVLAVAHTRTKTAKEIRRVASFAIEKPQRSRPDRARILDSEGGKDVWEERAEYQGLTDTAERYDEHEASSFAVTIAYDDEADSGESVDADAVDRDRQIQTAIRAVENGHTYEEASKLVDYSADWVGKMYRAWDNENQHTELVPKTDEPEP